MVRALHRLYIGIADSQHAYLRSPGASAASSPERPCASTAVATLHSAELESSPAMAERRAGAGATPAASPLAEIECCDATAGHVDSNGRCDAMLCDVLREDTARAWTAAPAGGTWVKLHTSASDLPPAARHGPEQPKAACDGSMAGHSEPCVDKADTGRQGAVGLRFSNQTRRPSTLATLNRLHYK